MKFPKITPFFLNMLSVVLGVLLAFAIGEWRADIQNRKTRKMALESIAAEIRENHRIIDYKYDYFNSISRQIDSIKINDPEQYINSNVTIQRIKGWNGATPPAVRSHSYRMVVETGMAKHLNFKENHRLASIYSTQAMIEKFNDALVLKAMSDKEIYSIDYIHRYFQLYLELLPWLMSAYQHEGKEILVPFGYDMEVNSNNLRENIQRQKE